MTRRTCGIAAARRRGAVHGLGYRNLPLAGAVALLLAVGVAMLSYGWERRDGQTHECRWVLWPPNNGLHTTLSHVNGAHGGRA